jgi:hypothetical protein
MVTINSNPRQAPAPAAMRTPTTTAADTPNAPTTGGEADRHRPSTNWMHPRVHKILIAVTAWFALAVWSFAGHGIVNYLLFIVSGFMFVAVALPLLLSNVGRDGRAAARKEHAPSLRDWAKCEYETSAGKLSGAEAATQILLPVAAAAVGMTLIGMIFYFSTPAGARPGI